MGKTSGFTIRRARPQDKEVVLDFTQNTFGEMGDYIAYIWDDWLADRQGFFWAAEAEGRAVGIAKLTFHSPGEAWMEGLRVNPQYRGLGVAHALHQLAVEKAEEKGVGVVRLATHSDNTPVHHMAEEFGFRKLAAFAYYWAKRQSGEARPPFIIHEDLFKPTRDLVFSSEFYRAGHGLIGESMISWVWKELSEDRLREYINQEKVLAYIGPGGIIDALGIVTGYGVGEEEELWISFLDGKPAAVQELALALRRGEVEAMLPESHPTSPLLEEIGYQRGIEGQMWVFEKRFA